MTAAQAALGEQLICRERANRLAASRPGRKLALDPEIDFAEMRHTLRLAPKRIDHSGTREARLFALRQVLGRLTIVNAECSRVTRA